MSEQALAIIDTDRDALIVVDVQNDSYSLKNLGG